MTIMTKVLIKSRKELIWSLKSVIFLNQNHFTSPRKLSGINLPFFHNMLLISHNFVANVCGFFQTSVYLTVVFLFALS